MAYSGGLDSTVLLHYLAHSEFANVVSAVHVHHGISPNADAWERGCRENCNAWGVTFECRRTKVDAMNQGLEAAARDARYAIFQEVIQTNDVLALAHHQDDQAETFMFRLARGAGLDGLCAIPAIRPLGLLRDSDLH